MSKEDKLELVRGSGNVFRDLGLPNADLEQAKAILAAKIIGVLDDRGWSTREAEKETGIAHTELSRIREPKLDGMTLDKLMHTLVALGQDVEIIVRPRRDPQQPARLSVA